MNSSLGYPSPLGIPEHRLHYGNTPKYHRQISPARAFAVGWSQFVLPAHQGICVFPLLGFDLTILAVVLLQGVILIH